MEDRGVQQPDRLRLKRTRSSCLGLGIKEWLVCIFLPESLSHGCVECACKMMRKIRDFDIYPKTLEDFRVRTTSGAIISIASLIVATFLFSSELYYYLSPMPQYDMTVDVSRGGKMKIKLNVTFHAVPCEGLSLDVMDVTGEHRVDVSHDIYKVIVAHEDSGNVSKPQKSEPGEDAMQKQLAEALEKFKKPDDYCGPCYGAEMNENECCQTCNDVKKAYARRGWAVSDMEQIEQCYREALERRFENNRKEGCNVYGTLEVNKVAGNFHFAPGRSYENPQGHVHDFLPFELEDFDVSHTIHSLNFGFDEVGYSNPLDNTSLANADGSKKSGIVQYFLKVVPTIVVGSQASEDGADGHKSSSAVAKHQYSVTQNFREYASGQQGVLPGVFFIYDLSPIMVRATVERVPFTHFLTSVCAIVGGVISVAALIDSAFFHGLRSWRKKNQLGKAI